MAEESLSARLAEVESMIDRSRRRFEEGSRLVEEAHKALADIQQELIGSPVSLSPEDSEEAASRLLTSLKAAGGRSTRSSASSASTAIRSASPRWNIGCSSCSPSRATMWSLERCC